MQDMSAVRAAAKPVPVVSLALQEALRSWDGLLDCLPVGVYTCDLDGKLVQYNRRAAELWGHEPDVTQVDRKFCGAHRVYRLNGEPLPVGEAAMNEVLQTGKPVRDREMIFERLDGSRIAILANLDPLFDRDGKMIGAVNCLQDITALKQIREQLRDRERISREILEALPAAIYTTDADGRITYYNRAATDLAGTKPVLGTDSWCVTWKLFHPDGTPMPHDQCPMALALKEDRPIRGGEAIAERPDGKRVPFIPFPTPLHDASGKLIGAVNMLLDITERKESEAQQNRLMEELNHRVKNTLATVQSLAGQSFRRPGVPPDARNVFEARLYALARAHDQLTMTHWQSADLKLLAENIFAPYEDDGKKHIHVDGPSVALSPRAALTFAMVLHELATNAVKYGSLSTPRGGVKVAWSVANGVTPPTLHFRWQESGGPPIVAPEKRGFGTRLVEQGVRRELEGKAEIAFEPAGLQCRIEIPLTQRED